MKEWLGKFLDPEDFWDEFLCATFGGLFGLSMHFWALYYDAADKQYHYGVILGVVFGLLLWIVNLAKDKFTNLGCLIHCFMLVVVFGNLILAFVDRNLSQGYLLSLLTTFCLAWSASKATLRLSSKGE